MEVLQRTANRGSISTGYDIDNSLKLKLIILNHLLVQHKMEVDRKKVTISFWTKKNRIRLVCLRNVIKAGVNGSKYSALGFQDDTNTLDFIIIIVEVTL